jgi:uncharacterized membrane protein
MTYRRRLCGCLFLIVACALAVLLVAPTASAQPISWRIDSLDVLLDVQENGDVIVDETYGYTFEGNYHFVERNIPLENMAGIADIEVTDASCAVLPESNDDALGTFRAYEEGGQQYIRVNFDITDASVTYTFHYQAKQMILFWDEGDELRWHVFDAEMPVFIGAAKITVTLPGEVASSDIAPAVEAGYGVQWTATSPAPSTMVYEATDIPPYTQFWTVTGFPKGVVKYVWTARRLADYLVPIVGLFLPIASLLTMLLIWLRRGRDEPALVYANYVSDIPSDLRPGLVGALMDEKVDSKEVLATIVDLARRGYLDITDTKEEGHIRKPLTTFTRLKPLDDLQGYEKKVAESLFDIGSDDQVTSAQLKNHFYSKIPPIVDQIYTAVTTAGLFRKNPKKERKHWVRYGFLVLVILVLVAIAFKMADIAGWGWFLIGSIVATIIVWIFGPRMPQRTVKGAQERRKWEAFRNYLNDLTRFTDMEAAKEKFETTLPYAIALGVEKDWVRRFEDLTVPAPDWYHPPVIIADWTGSGPISAGGGPISTGGLGGGFSLDTISDGLFGSLRNMSDALTSFPTSSGSGSRGAFGGGGFSGGGGGFGGGFSGGGGGGGMHAG